MKVVFMCEESGIGHDAFAALGHDAWSCDILPRSGKHICGDARVIRESLKQWLNNGGALPVSRVRRGFAFNPNAIVNLESRSSDGENPCISPGETLQCNWNGESHASFTHPDGVTACTVYDNDLVGLHEFGR